MTPPPATRAPPLRGLREREESRSSAVVGAAAGVAQPQAHQQAFALDLGPVAERRALVAERAVVDDLHLARLEMEARGHARRIEDRLEGVQRGGAPRIDLHAGELVAVLHLEA